MEPTQQRSNRRKTGFTVRLRGLVGNPRLTPGRGRQGRDDTPTPLGFIVGLLNTPAPSRKVCSAATFWEIRICDHTIGLVIRERLFDASPVGGKDCVNSLHGLSAVELGGPVCTVVPPPFTLT